MKLRTEKSLLNSSDVVDVNQAHLDWHTDLILQKILKLGGLGEPKAIDNFSWP